MADGEGWQYTSYQNANGEWVSYIDWGAGASGWDIEQAKIAAAGNIGWMAYAEQAAAAALLNVDRVAVATALVSGTATFAINNATGETVFATGSDDISAAFQNVAANYGAMVGTDVISHSYTAVASFTGVATGATMVNSAPNSAGTVAGGSGGSALGNALRRVPFLGGTLGALGDVVSGVGNVALGVASLGQSGTFGRGLGQVGSGVGVFAADIGAAAYGFSVGKITSVALGAGNLLTGNYFAANYPNDPKPESRGFFSGVSNFVRSVVIPTYGFNLGVNYGGVQQGFVPPQSARSFNQLDSVSYQHDLDQNNRNWVRSSSSSQGGTTATGPVGAIINIIGAPVFWLTPSR